MPYKSSEGRSGGKLVKSNLSDNIGGYCSNQLQIVNIFMDLTRKLHYTLNQELKV